MQNLYKKRAFIPFRQLAPKTYSIFCDYILSQQKSNVNAINGYSWKELSQKAYITKDKIEEVFYSEEKKCLITATFSCLKSSYTIITLKQHKDDVLKNDYTDELTKLPNRKSFSSDINNIIDYSTENNKKFALLLIDIDDIKSINSSQGFEAGDLLLVRVATILKRFEKNNIYDIINKE